MRGKDIQSKNDKDKSMASDLLLPLDEAVAELKAAEINYNNSYNSYQEDVFFYEIQAAKAKISLITNINKSKNIEMNKEL